MYHVCFRLVYPTLLSSVSHSIAIHTVVIKNIRNMHAVSTNQIADILHFNNNTYNTSSATLYSNYYR